MDRIVVSYAAQQAAALVWTFSRFHGERIEGSQGSILPRSLPHVGFLRHAPQLALHGQLDKLLKRHKVQEALVDRDRGRSEFESHDDALPEKPGRTELVLPRQSPYVGFRRHAPPSPKLCFSQLTSSSLASHVSHSEPQGLPRIPLHGPGSWESNSFTSVGGLFAASAHWPSQRPQRRGLQPQMPSGLPEEVWSLILRDVIEVSDLHYISRVTRGFSEAVRTKEVWDGRLVSLLSVDSQRLAPWLHDWLPAWRNASRLVLPRSSQLLAEVSHQVPDVLVEVAWRFDSHLKGDGVEVLNRGLTARRIDDEELVVLGDASIPIRSGRAPYLEVRLDERCEEENDDDLNDFGLGITVCDPEELYEIGAVADEVPRSWVVDFTQSSVVLSVNNHEVAKGSHLSSKDLHEGNRVGIRILPVAVEVFIDGRLRERLSLDSGEKVPQGCGLFPVLDLYGRTMQITRMFTEEPLP